MKVGLSIFEIQMRPKPQSKSLPKPLTFSPRWRKGSLLMDGHTNKDTSTAVTKKKPASKQKTQ
jgi:hypothetical protein